LPKAASAFKPNSSDLALINRRSDGIVVGGMMEPRNWSLDPNEEVRRQNVNASMRHPSGPTMITRSALPRTIPRLESFNGVES